MTTTPLRSVGRRTDEGWIAVSDPGSDYADGAETRVYEILTAAADLSSTSDELLTAASTWPERYHLSPTRANVIRALDLPPEAVVLEIGAGCGAVTRYLGERCRTVDALEPVPSRARAARARNRDLPGVEVFVADVSDIPPVPAYDLIVVVGVLEYVGRGTADPAPYREFLATIAGLLRPGGTLALAIENRLGVKYLCGAPEDHSSRIFDSVEGYPYGSPARTFSRRELTGLLDGAGLRSKMLVAFPDYKMPRVVFDATALSGPAESLLFRVPVFPSPDWTVQREQLADERSVWRSFVEAGLATEAGNSFLALATAPPADSAPLWPSARAGVYFSSGRRAEFTTQTEIVIDPDSGGVGLVRHRQRPDLPEPPEASGLQLRVEDAEFVPGTDLLDLIRDADDPTTGRLLQQWVRLVETAPDRGLTPIDLLPHNIVVDGDGQLAVIDQEWFHTSISPEQTLQRGALLLPVHLVGRGLLVGDWSGCATVRDMVDHVGAVVGPHWSDDWIDRTVELESRLQTLISADRAPDGADRRRADIEGMLDRAVDGPRHLEHRQSRLRADAEAAHALRHELHLAREDAHRYRVGSEEADTLRHELHLARQDAHHFRISAQEAATVRHELHLTRQKVAELQQSVSAAAAELQGHHDDADLAAREHVDELATLRNSTSWRVTAPLRYLRSRLNR